MKHLQSSLWVMLAITLMVGSCGEKEPEEPVKTEEEIRLEQEAARRSEETSALSDRASRVTGNVGQLAQRGGSELPESLQSAVSGLDAKRAEVERLLGELEQAGADGWEAAKARLESALEELEAAASSASSEVEQWQAREAAVLAARAEGSPIDPETGLILGLDGGDYEPYKDEVIVRVQELFREQGRYAGPADGELDSVLMEALGSFQTEENLQVSGVPSPMTRSRLFG